MEAAAYPETIYDIVIFGASGFTGKYVIREALKFLNTPASPLKTLALAGRSATKLAQSLEWAAHPSSPPKFPFLIADTSDPESLRRLASQSKLILNCVGPFRLYGEPVVEACVNMGCDYLDICGEPEFMELIEAKYHEKAVEKGVLVISACGFDSVPAELGFFFNSRQWASPSVPNKIEAYLSLESEKRMVGNLGTYESAVLGVANADKLQKLRSSRPKRSSPQIPGPQPNGSVIEHQKKIGFWALKLPSADASVVRRTLALLTNNPSGIPNASESAEQVRKRETFWSGVKPAHFGVKFGSKSLLEIFRFITFGILIGLFGKFEFGRWALLKYPSLFSLGLFKNNGPSEDEVASASFKMWFIGQGYSDKRLLAQGEQDKNKLPDMEIITRVMGPEIGYLTTPIILVQCGLILLHQRDTLLKGGVFTPGIVFGPTDLQKRLEENGISFDVVSKNPLLP